MKRSPNVVVADAEMEEKKAAYFWKASGRQGSPAQTTQTSTANP